MVAGGDFVARPKKPEGEQHVRLSTSLPPDLFDRLCKFCQKEDVSIAWVARRAITEWLEKHGG